MALTRLTSANAIPDDSVANVKMANIVQSKNIIINGDCSVAQRTTSTSSVSSGSTYVVDRTFVYVTNAGTWTMSQDTAVPSGSGFGKSIKLDCTTADASLGAADYIAMQQRIEGQNLQYIKKGTSSAESLTLSFWVYATKTGTNICELYDADNTRQISKSYTVDTTNTWEKKTITFAGDTSGTLDNDNATSMTLLFWLGAGSNYTSGTLNTSWASATNANRAVGQVNHADSTSNNFYITGIQLEAGDTASEFEFLPYDVNLQRCYRYFELINTGGVGKITGTGGSYDNNVLLMSYTWVTKRTTPSIYQVSGTDYFYFYGSGSENDAFDLWKIYSANYLGGLLYSDDSSISVSDNVIGWFQLNNSAAVLGLNAEL